MPGGVLKGFLVALAIACAIGAFGVERFGYELCHRGLPLAALTVGTPIVGTLAAVASLFFRSRLPVVIVKVTLLLINGYQLVLALVVASGIGIAPCG